MHWTLVPALWLCTGCEISDMALSVSALVVASPAPSCRKPTVSCCVLFMLGFFFFYGGFVRGRKISLRVDLWSLPPYIESQNHSTQQSARAGLLRMLCPWHYVGEGSSQHCPLDSHRPARTVRRRGAQELTTLSRKHTHAYAFWFSGFDDLRAQNIPERSVFSSQPEASCLPPVNRRARPSRARRRRRWRPLG